MQLPQTAQRDSRASVDLSIIFKLSLSTPARNKQIQIRIFTLSYLLQLSDKGVSGIFFLGAEHLLRNFHWVT